MEQDELGILQLTDKFDLRASGENDRCSVSQISPGYYNMNAVAFYLLKGRLLVAFYEVQGTATTCVTFRNVEPDEIAVTLNEKLGFPLNADVSRDVVTDRGFFADTATEAGVRSGSESLLRGEHHAQGELRDFLPCVSCRRREIIENSKPFRKKPACR